MAELKISYPFTAYKAQVEDHVFWVVESLTLKGCIGQGDTVQEALDELVENEAEWIRVAVAHGVFVPSIPMRPLGEETEEKDDCNL